MGNTRKKSRRKKRNISTAAIIIIGIALLIVLFLLTRMLLQGLGSEREPAGNVTAIPEKTLPPSLLEDCGQRGYTVWEEIGGRGSETGEPHLGNHAWPTQNHAVLTAVDDALVAEIMDRLRTTDRDNPKLGLRAYVLPVEDAL